MKDISKMLAIAITMPIAFVLYKFLANNMLHFTDRDLIIAATVLIGGEIFYAIED